MSVFSTHAPAGGRWATVGDFYEITRKPRELRLGDTVPFVPMDAIPQDGSFEPAYCDKRRDELTSGTYFQKGDLLVAKITPSFENGKQAIADLLPSTFGYATTEVIPLHAKAADHDKRFLFYFLLHPEVRSFVAEKMEGATGRQRVPESVLLTLPFPDISHSDQCAIAEALDLVQLAVALERKAEAATTALKHAAMCAVFAGGLRREPQKETALGLVPRSWEVSPIGDRFTVVSGGTPSRSNPSYWEPGTIPWVKTTEIDYATILETEERISQEGLVNSSAKLLNPGTLLMAMYGQGVTRGKVALLGIEAACNQACAAFTPKGSEVGTEYLFHFLTSRYEDVRRLAHGGQQQNLNLEIVRSIFFAYPTRTGEQQEIVNTLSAIDRKTILHRRKRDALQRLFRAVLHKLLTGEVQVSKLDVSTSLASIKATA